MVRLQSCTFDCMSPPQAPDTEDILSAIGQMADLESQSGKEFSHVCLFCSAQRVTRNEIKYFTYFLE